jgi:BlaI family transcriptional regulator, penicillinase repressor
VSDFVNCLFGGDPVPLLLHLAGRSKLSGGDVKRLKRLIEESAK